MKKACCRIGWRPVLGLVARIMLVLTVARSPQGEGFGQFSSDVGPAEEVTNGIQQVPPAAPSFAVLYSFTGGADGAYPFARLIRDGAGNLYGTTYEGGATGTCEAPYGCGVVFKLSPTGTETVLHTFTGGADGRGPQAGLIRDAADNLYGTTVLAGAHGSGVVFELSPSGTETVLYSFTGGADGGFPYAGLIRDAAGNLYGTTGGGGAAGGCRGGCGVVFKLSPTGTETVLHSFTGADGRRSRAGLIRDAAGNLYGTTFRGGAHGGGVVFRLSPSGTETVLYSFTRGADGANPYAGLIRDAAGNLYGTTEEGGATGTCDPPYGCGVVFKLSPTGTETVLHRFIGADGANPHARLVRDAALNLYGTTVGGGAYGWGVVFRLAP